jgi:hypothetical protein
MPVKVTVVVLLHRGHNKMPLKKVVTIRRRDTDPNRIPRCRCPDAVYDLDPILDEIAAENAAMADAFLQSEMPLTTDLKRRILSFLF